MDERKKNIPNKLEMSERELYSKKGSIKNITRHELHTKDHSIPQSWDSSQQEMTKKKKKKHLMHSKKFRTLFFLAVVFFLGSLFFTFFTFFQGGAIVSNSNIDIIVLGNSFVDGGEELPLQIKVANRNRTSIEIADVLVEYSKGVGGVNDVARERISLGEIGSGRIVEEIVNISLFGEQGSTRDVNFTLEYRVENSNAVFVKNYTYQVTIATSPVDVRLTGPNTVISNQIFTTDVRVVQNSTEVTKNMMVSVNYPSGFRFERAEPKPDFGNNTWFLGDLAPGVEKNIKIEGAIRASNGEERIITVMSGSQNPKDEQVIGVQFTSTPLQIEIGTPFVSANISSGEQNQNDSNQITISSTGESTFTVNWENELSNSLSNLEIRARFSGNGFDPSRVTVNQGFFDNNQNTITWNQTNNSNLNNIQPGQTGQLSFSLTPKTGVSNPTISVALDARGVIVGQGTRPEEVNNIYNGTIRIASDASVGSSLYFSNGPFTNAGSLPPKVGQETTYTVEWTVSSSSSALDEVKLTADLPSYITWKNEIFPQDQNISYNSVTRKVTWNAGQITPGTAGQKKAYFKIGFTPSSSQINSSPVVISGGNFQGKDTFTGESVSRNFGQITTSLSRDSQYNASNDRVSE